jgi:hypothetical protein
MQRISVVTCTSIRCCCRFYRENFLNAVGNAISF